MSEYDAKQEMLDHNTEMAFYSCNKKKTLTKFFRQTKPGHIPI